MRSKKLYWLLLIITFCCCCSRNEYREFLKLREYDRAILSHGKIVTQTNGLDDISRNQIEGMANDIKMWTSEAHFFPWEDVALSILKYPDDINFNAGQCEKCSDAIISIHFVSPDWTWAKLCGRCGYLRICPTCKKQIAFKMSGLN